jgi:beta-lactamase regulating signal transducer with metallopeptidase domain
MSWPTLPTHSVPLGWTLTHALWQTMLLALLFVAWRAWRRPTVRVSYRIAAGALAAGAAAAVLTLWALASAGLREGVAAQTSAPGQGDVLFFLPTALGAPHALPSPHSNGVGLPSLTSLLGGLTLVWVCGALVLALRLFGGLLLAARIRQRAEPTTSKALLSTYARVASRLVPSRPVELLESDDIDAPATVGHRHPAILIPRALAREDTEELLEPLVAHELAHIHAADYAANLAQIGVDVVLFLCPGARWLSAEVRRLREYRCDDLALSLCQSPVGYAQALARVAETSRRAIALPAPGIAGPRLVDRIRRLLEGETMTGLSPSRAAALALVIPVVTIGGAWLMAASLVHAKQNATPTAAVSVSPAMSGEAAIPISISPCLADCPVRIEGAHSSTDFLFETVTVRNVGDKPMTSVTIGTFLWSNEGDQPPHRTQRIAAKVPADLKPGAALTLTIDQGPLHREAWAFPKKPCDLAKVLSGEGPHDLHCDTQSPPPLTAAGREQWPWPFPRVLEYKEKWPRATADLVVLKAERTDGTTWGWLEGFLLLDVPLVTKAPAQYSEFCLQSERGMKATNGFSIRANSGQWATCKNGSWVETP